MRFKNQPLTRQITAAFTVLVFILLGVSVLAIVSLSDAQSNFDNFVGDEFNRGSMARDVRSAASARAIAARNLILLTGPDDVAAETAAVKAAHERVQERMATLKRVLQAASDANADERALYERLAAIETRYGPVALAIVDKALAGDKEAAIAQMNAECQPLLKQLIATATEYTKLMTSSAEREIQYSAKVFRTKRMELVVFALLAVACAILLGTMIKRSVHRLLGADPQQLRAAAMQVSSGDLSPLPGSATAPPDSVLATLADMQQSLARMVSSVRASASAIEAGSQDIAAGNSDLSARTEQEAANLQQSAAQMDKITASVSKNAATADRASELASTARNAAEHGGAMVGQVVGTMGQISESSRRIVDIIGVIDGIAFQTNILALNAAVEAARAGEQGRGFAVVASEVRNLAQRSAQAAHEIKGLIESSVNMVETGANLVNGAGAAMTKIVDEVNRVASLISEMTDANREQTTSIGHIGKTVSSVDRSTQQNASLVQEMATAAGNLNTQAHSLVEAVAVFRLG